LLGEALQRAVKLLEIEHAIARQKVEVITVEFATVLTSVALEGLLRHLGVENPAFEVIDGLLSRTILGANSGGRYQAQRKRRPSEPVQNGSPPRSGDSRHPQHLSSLVTGPKSLRFVYAVGDERP
jgi:hypothetical protein